MVIPLSHIVTVTNDGLSPKNSAVNYHKVIGQMKVNGNHDDENIPINLYFIIKTHR